MRSLYWTLPGLLLLAALFSVTAAAQSAASHKFNKIVSEMEAHYYSCAEGLRGKARTQAYIDHGKLEAEKWEGYLREFPDSKLAFPARLYLAKALHMAKEKERAVKVIEDSLKDAIDVRRMKQAAEALKVVHSSSLVPAKFIEENYSKLDDIEERAELHFELLQYIATPKKMKKKDKKVFRRKKHAEIVTAVAKLYPKTRSGREAALMVRGLNLKVGDPLINLDEYHDEDGKALDLHEYKGKVILLHFWTGRSASKRYLAEVLALYKELKPKGLEIIGINGDYREDKERRMDLMVETLGITWRNYHDGEKLLNKIALVFYVRKFPFNIIIGRDGKIASIGEDTRNLEDVLAELIGKS